MKPHLGPTMGVYRAWATGFGTSRVSTSMSMRDPAAAAKARQRGPNVLERIAAAQRIEEAKEVARRPKVIHILYWERHRPPHNVESIG